MSDGRQPVALTASETFGTVVPGFVTDLDGRLIVTNTPESETFGTVVAGFLTDADGRISISTGS